MKIICKYCEGTGKLGFQREGCCFCGGSGFVDNLVHNHTNINVSNIKPMKDANDIQYKGDLDKYFKEVEECNISNNIISILLDMYKELNNIKIQLNINRLIK